MTRRVCRGSLSSPEATQTLFERTGRGVDVSMRNDRTAWAMLFLQTVGQGRMDDSLDSVGWFAND
ncbi:hypothetical protein HALLA_06370 [Halostagnicola larsenii XH-48]|uniref:Uncharacterized protein n=1 Tax=Halostagnicola larsenii XH-48 TaxID=797299 RepID=W0JU36_9EURY|nr:hypothetical protein HALLA_06370 [Halostagnicola larsenii XH-48]